MRGKKIVWIVIAVMAVVVALLLLRAHRLRSISMRQLLIEGAVMQSATDVNKELPIADVAITASNGRTSAVTHSEASGYFKVMLQKGVLSSTPVTVSFRHSAYEPFDLQVQTGRLELPNKLYVVH